MTSPSSTKSANRPVATTLFAIATLAPISLGAFGSGFAPAWAGAVVGGTALFGGLIATWREGGLRALFIVLLAGTVAASAIAGWIMSRSN